MEALQNIADIVGADQKSTSQHFVWCVSSLQDLTSTAALVEITAVVLDVIMHGLPLSEQSSVHPITGEIRKLFPERMHVNVHASMCTLYISAYVHDQ